MVKQSKRKLLFQIVSYLIAFMWKLYWVSLLQDRKKDMVMTPGQYSWREMTISWYFRLCES